MNALSLWQPWATLILREAKRIETRSWPAPARIIGEQIAIHATKGNEHHWLRGTEPFATELGDEPWPLGAIICTCMVIATEVITPDLCHAIHQGPSGHLELAYGDYRTGRHAWHLGNVQPLSSPIACTGHQGIWRVPDDVVEAIAFDGLTDA